VYKGPKGAYSLYRGRGRGGEGGGRGGGGGKDE